MAMTARHPYVRAWRAIHDNGWEAWVGEDTFGDFDVWVCPAEETVVRRETVEDTELHAKDAALLALKIQSHHDCSRRCGNWALVPEATTPVER